MIPSLWLEWELAGFPVQAKELFSSPKVKCLFLMPHLPRTVKWSKGEGAQPASGVSEAKGSKCGAIIVRAGRVQPVWRWGDQSGVPTDPPRCASGPGFLPSCHSFSLREMLPCPLQKWRHRRLPTCFGEWPLVCWRSIILLPMTDEQSSDECSVSPCECEFILMATTGAPKLVAGAREAIPSLQTA